MRKLMVLVLALSLSLMFTGCCKRVETDGTTTKNFLNCLRAAQDTACNPPAEVMNIINPAAQVIATALNIFVPASTAYINADSALTWIKTLQTTGCLGLTELNKLIAYLQSADFQEVQTMATKVAAAKGLKAAPVSINIQPLLDWQAKFKK